MSRFIAFLTTVAALACGAWLGKSLWDAQAAGQVAPPEVEIALANSGEESASEARRARGWPALFGELEPPSSAPPEQPEPQPPQPVAPAAPPLDSQGYGLSGIIRSGDKRWAIVTHPTGDKILKAGDELADGARVLEITADGIVVETPRGRETLDLPKE